MNSSTSILCRVGLVFCLIIGAISSVLAQPPGNTCTTAPPAIVNAPGQSCAYRYAPSVNLDGTTNSGLTADCLRFQDLDRFYTWTATTDGLEFGLDDSGVSLPYFIGLAVWTNVGSPNAPQCGELVACSYSAQASILEGWDVGDDLLIQATWEAGSIGSFCLNAFNLVAPINDVCSRAISLQCNAGITSASTEGSTSESFEICGEMIGRGQWFEIPAGPQDVTIEIEHEVLELDVTIFRGNCTSLEELQCARTTFGVISGGGGTFNVLADNVSRYMWVSPDPVRANGINGPFTIKAESCVNAPPLLPESLCSTAPTLVLDAPAVNLSFSGSTFQRPPGVDEAGVTMWYSFVGHDGYVLIPKSLGFNSTPYIYTGVCGSLVPLDSSSIVGDYSRTIEVDVDVGVRYFVANISSNSFRQSTGASSSVEVLSRIPAPNQLCENATLLTCSRGVVQDSMWDRGYSVSSSAVHRVFFTFVGDGLEKELTVRNLTDNANLGIKIYEGDCSVISNGNAFSFETNILDDELTTVFKRWTIPGITYTVLMYYRDGNGVFNSNRSARYEIQLGSCQNVPPPANDRLEDAELLICRHESSWQGGTTVGALPDDEVPNQQGAGIWFRYPGDGSRVSVAKGNSPSDLSFSFSIFRQLSDGSLESMPLSTAWGGHDGDFYAAAGEEYLIYVVTEPVRRDAIQKAHRISIGLRCTLPLENDICNDAELIYMDGPFADIYLFNGLDEGREPECSNAGYSDSWYQFVAPITGALRVLALNGLDLYELSLHGDCGGSDALMCFEEDDVIGGLEPFRTYYIRAQGDRRIIRSTGSFRLVTNPSAPVADRCTSAQEIIVDGASINFNTLGMSTTFDILYEWVGSGFQGSYVDSWFRFEAPDTGAVLPIVSFSPGQRTANVSYLLFEEGCDLSQPPLRYERGITFSANPIEWLTPGEVYYLTIVTDSDNSQEDIPINFRLRGVARTSNISSPRESNLLELWPNPTSEFVDFDLSFGSLNGVRVTVIDAVGRPCAVDVQREGSKIRVGVQHLVKGLYSVTVSGPRGQYTGQFFRE